MENVCPTCSDRFDSSFGMKVHHKLSHGNSLVEKESVCSIKECENKFKYYPSEKEGTICPKCIKDGKNVIHTDKFSKEDIARPDGETEHIDVVCYICGEEDEVIPSRVGEGKYLCSRSCLDDYNSERMSGKDNPRYVDGKSLASSYDRSWIKVKEEALQRDNYKCCICSSKDNLHVHHLKPVRTFEEPKDSHFVSNAITLCATCHPKVEHGNKVIPKSILDNKDLVKPEVIY